MGFTDPGSGISVLQAGEKTILHVLRRYRDFEARYLKIIWVFVYFLPVLYYVPNGLTDIQVMFLDDILVILIMVFSILSIVQRQRRVMKDYKFLSEQQKMAEYHYQVLTEQIPEWNNISRPFRSRWKKLWPGLPKYPGDAETVCGQPQSNQSSGAAGDLL